MTYTDNQLLTIKDVQQSLSVSRSKIYLDMGAAGFPAPVKLGKSSRWVGSEVAAWVQAQADKRITPKA
jgi:prophage regulatory protein